MDAWLDLSSYPSNPLNQTSGTPFFAVGTNILSSTVWRIDDTPATNGVALADILCTNGAFRTPTTFALEWKNTTGLDLDADADTDGDGWTRPATAAVSGLGRSMAKPPLPSSPPHGTWLGSSGAAPSLQTSMWKAARHMTR